jgi:hypothetical protein
MTTTMKTAVDAKEAMLMPRRGADLVGVSVTG